MKMKLDHTLKYILLRTDYIKKAETWTWLLRFFFPFLYESLLPYYSFCSIIAVVQELTEQRLHEQQCAFSGVKPVTWCGAAFHSHRQHLPADSWNYGK